MLERLVQNWWVLALRGVVAILFAVIAFARPQITLQALVWVWGFYAVADGIFATVTAIRSAELGGRWGMLLLSGISGIAAGIVAFAWPGITAVALLYLVAAWAVMTGFLEIAAAIALREVLEGEWMLGLSGVLSVVLGVLLFARPGAGLLASVWMIGVYALIAGIAMLVLAFRIRALGNGPFGRPVRAA